MNREIKFRAWDRFKKKMYKVYDLRGDSATGELCELWLNDESEVGVNLFPSTLANCVLMQYTGLKDKNGKEAYDDDVIAFNVPEKFGTDIRYKGQIYFCDKRLAYCVKCKAWDMPIKHNILDIEVIGNIHESPELMEKE